MKRHKIIKTDKGRISIQTNSFGIPEVKVKIEDNTRKIKCSYEEIENVEAVVEALLSSTKVQE